MSEADKPKQGEIIPVKDEAGNYLSIGCGVVWTGCRNMNHLRGRVTDWKKGGVSLIETGEKHPKETPALVRVTFEMLVQLIPGQPNILGGYFRTINPQAETLIGKILEKSDLTM
jgi:hypothetical protein